MGFIAGKIANPIVDFTARDVWWPEGNLVTPWWISHNLHWNHGFMVSDEYWIHEKRGPSLGVRSKATEVLHFWKTCVKAMDPRNGMGSKSRSSNIWAGDSWVLSKSPISPLNIHIFGLVNLPCFPSNLGFRVPNFPRHPMNMPINTAWVLYKNSLYKNLRGSNPRRATYFQFFL